MRDIALAAGMIEAEARDKLASATTLEQKIHAAFSAAKNHWMFTEENTQFVGAVGAILLHATEEEKERIEAEMLALRALSALGGLHVSLPDPHPNPVGLRKLWAEWSKS